MSNVPADAFGSTGLPLPAVPPAKRVAVRLWRLACACISAAADAWRERALRRMERGLAIADSSFSRASRDVMQIEARRLL